MKKTNERLAALLREDLARGKVDRKALAAACKVSKQAISNWIRDGRIDKENLSIVARFTGRAVDYYMSGEKQKSERNAGQMVCEEQAPYIVKPPDSPTHRRELLTKLFAMIEVMPTDDLEKLIGDTRAQMEQNARILEEYRQSNPKAAA